MITVGYSGDKELPVAFYGNSGIQMNKYSAVAFDLRHDRGHI